LRDTTVAAFTLIPAWLNYVLLIPLLLVQLVGCSGQAEKEPGEEELLGLLESLNNRDLDGLEKYVDLSNISRQWAEIVTNEVVAEMTYQLDSIRVRVDKEVQQLDQNSPMYRLQKQMLESSTSMGETVISSVESFEEAAVDRIRNWISEWWQYGESNVEINSYDISWLFSSFGSRELQLDSTLVIGQEPNVLRLRVYTSSRGGVTAPHLELMMWKIDSGESGENWKIVKIENLLDLAQSVRTGRTIFYGHL